MGKLYQILSCDPPYSFSDRLTMSDVKRGAKANYSTMSIKDICSMSVKDIIDPKGALLALWVPSSLIQYGLDIMKAWGFKQKQTWIWVKTKKDPIKKIDNKIENCLSFGMGRIARNTHELALVGTTGKIYEKVMNRSQRTVFFAPNIKHSQKPAQLQNQLDIIFPDTDDYSLNRLEIFARQARPGWDTIGNQSPSSIGEDVFTSIDKIKHM